MESKKDAKNYAAMSLPHENQQAAETAIEGFYDELSELRKKYKIRDCLVTIYDSKTNSDGEIGEFINSMHFGNSSHGLMMAAYTFGQLKIKDSENISKLASGK